MKNEADYKNRYYINHKKKKTNLKTETKPIQVKTKKQ